jgi:hypothetical protein
MDTEKKIAMKLAEWTREYDPDQLIRIDKKIVHKVHEENNFVSRIEQIETGDADSFLSQVAVDRNHSFFFEHEYDHIPGLLMVEAGRQIGTAIAHLFYQVSFDTVFILNEMNIRFFKYVELAKPLFIKSTVRNKLIRKGKLIAMEHDGYFIQDGHEVAYMGGTWQMYDKKIIERFRKKSSRSAALDLE